MVDDQPLVKIRQNVAMRGASEAIRAGLAKAQELGIEVGIVVTDSMGEIVGAANTDGASPKAWQGAHMKATSAARMGVATADFLEKRLKNDEVLWRAMSSQPGSFIVPGGVPLKYQGTAVGGVGVSGGHYDDDAKVAQAAADRFAELAEQE